MNRSSILCEHIIIRCPAVLCAICMLNIAFGCTTKTDAGIDRRIVQRNAKQTFYIKHQIAVFPYGDGDAELGLLQAPEMGANGPESFWVEDSGQIYICDTVNQKIKKLSRTGELLDQISLDFAGNDLAVDSNGDMFVLDRARRLVEQVNGFGKKRGAIQLDRHHVETAYNLRVVKDRVLLSSVMQEEKVLGKMHSGKMALRMSVGAQTPIVGGVVGRTERRFKTLRNERRQAEIDVFGKENQVLDSLLMPLENVASVVFLGEDRFGNSYYQLEVLESDRSVSLNVYCLDKRGNIDSAIENIPNNYYVWTAKLLQVAASGDVYQVLPTEDGVEVNVWERQ